MEKHRVDSSGECESCGRFLINDFWACPRSYTKGWGSGQVYERISVQFGKPDVAFGVTDGIPNTVYCIDKEAPKYLVDAGMAYRGDWKSLPFADNYFRFGYWDPPYDKLYKPEGQTIWRVVKRLAILHTTIYPIAYFEGAEREAVIAVTMGPLKKIRALQVYRKRTSLEEFDGP